MLTCDVYLCVFSPPVLPLLADAILDHVIGVTETASVFPSEREQATPRTHSGGKVPHQGQEEEEEEEEEWQDERRRMGVGKNTTSKSIEGGGGDGNANKYEEETKRGADFYPVPVGLRVWERSRSRAQGDNFMPTQHRLPAHVIKGLEVLSTFPHAYYIPPLSLLSHSLTPSDSVSPAITLAACM